MKTLDPSHLLLVGPLDDLAPACRAGALLDAAALGSSQAVPRSESGEDATPHTVATTFDPWPAAAGEAPNLPLLAWSLREDGEAMELILAGLEDGRRLEALGVELLIGPSLDPERWTGRPGGAAAEDVDENLAARASALYLQGLAAAGLLICADAFPPAGAEQITGRWRAFPHAFAHGLDAVRLDPAASSPAHAEPSCRLLRRELGFTGVILGRAASSAGKTAAKAAEAPRLLAAGCDLVQVPALDEALDAIEEALVSGELGEGRLVEASRRVAAFFDHPIG